ncbi:hypothetical protein [uncultured Vagococcus sp.]|uniref:hypothetical protein n=1 Tax=uncultured Vagococcus sp. TaxID=189676 RepID=UPI0028D90E60|nr:hypothetical protein [uncultured Vagococcus sp.]
MNQLTDTLKPHPLLNYHYYYSTTSPTVSGYFVIHKKTCLLLTKEKSQRRFIGYAQRPLDALFISQKIFPADSFILCQECGELLWHKPPNR